MSTTTDVTEPVIAASDSQTQESKKASDKEINFERLRKKLEAQESALQENQAVLHQQAQYIEQLKMAQNPVAQRDAWDDIPDGELIDKDKLRRTFEKEREKIRNEAEQIARQAFQKIEKENFAQRLKGFYPDYEQVLTRENAQKLEEKDPEYASLLTEVQDDFKRRELAYKRIKRMISETKVEPQVKAQTIVDENKKANYFHSSAGQSGTSNPYGFEFDVRNPQARQAAYQKLKAAQKRPI